MTVDYEKLKKITQALEMEESRNESVNILEGNLNTGPANSEELDEIDRLTIEHLNLIIDFVDRVLDGEYTEEEFIETMEKLHTNLEQNDQIFDSYATRFEELNEVVQLWHEQSERMHQAYQEFALFVEDEDTSHFRSGFQAIKAALHERKPLFAKFDEAMKHGGQTPITAKITTAKPDTNENGIIDQKEHKTYDMTAEDKEKSDESLEALPEDSMLVSESSFESSFTASDEYDDEEHEEYYDEEGEEIDEDNDYPYDEEE